jgi:peptidoglycan hydrolase-like protein with peptidoglycan-binding domain
MALQSRLFSGDPQLEAAAVSDPAHIVPGASGSHVAKIQEALNELDGANLVQDGAYGSATAAAVLAYKQKRSIINFSYETQADNIVGKMTMAALDREMVAKENGSTGPIQIKPIIPAPAGGGPSKDALVQRAGLLLAFTIDVDFPVFPNGNLLKIRLAPRSTGTLEIVNGKGGRVKCTNIEFKNRNADAEKISFIFDPEQPNFIPETRLNPVPRGPEASQPFSNGGTVPVTKDPFIVLVDAAHPGDAFVDAATATSANTLVLEVRAPKVPAALGFPPPKKTRPGSKFVSAIDSEPNPTGVNHNRPVNPKGTGRMINIFGSQETPGFDDYTSDLAFSSFSHGEVKNNASQFFRPWTEDPDPGVSIKPRTASDICIRDSPIQQPTIDAIRRIAGPGCRLTVGSVDVGARKFFPLLKREFPGAAIIEEFADAIVMELP